MKLAFVGPPAVGKDTVAAYVEKKYKLHHISSGDLLREYVKNNNLGDFDRRNLQIAGNNLRKKMGGDVLVKMAFEKVSDNLILSGLRAIDEVKTFKKLGGIVISINAPLERRYELAKSRGRIDDNVTLDDFIKIEEEENRNPDRNSQNVDEVISMSNLEILNDGSLDDLYSKSDELMKKILK